MFFGGVWEPHSPHNITSIVPPDLRSRSPCSQHGSALRDGTKLNGTAAASDNDGTKLGKLNGTKLGKLNGTKLGIHLAEEVNVVFCCCRGRSGRGSGRSSASCSAKSQGLIGHNPGQVHGQLLPAHDAILTVL